MIVAIPVDEDRKSLCVSFGRAPWMLFCNTETGVREALENPAAQAQGGAGLKAAQFLVDREAAALITVRCGENAAKVLQAAEITIYQSQGTDAEENLAALQEGRLQEMTHFHPGFVGIQP